jgi:hypothetical protein
MQRFWLTATRVGLQLQPELTPLIFRAYVREGIAFSTASGPLRLARSLAAHLERMIGREACERAVFMGRLGAGTPARARSLRLPLEKLLLAPSDR